MMTTFDDIYVLDLHGNTKKKEKCPDGSKDENVFDIQQGVAIGIFVKKSGVSKRPAMVHHAHLYGLREQFDQDKKSRGELIGGKYYWLAAHDVSSTEWQVVEPSSSQYGFVQSDAQLESEYKIAWSITDVLLRKSVGVVTARDHLTIHWDAKAVMDTVTKFANLPADEARTVFELGKDGQDWSVQMAQDDLQKSGPVADKVANVRYRPFDDRYTYYTGKSRGFVCRPRRETMRHMLAGGNLGLITTRQTRDNWGALATRNIITHKSLAAYDINSLFPLYLYPDPEKTDLFPDEIKSGAPGGRKPNLALEFVEVFAKKLKMKFIPDGKGDRKKTFGPEDVFSYIYTVFHSPEYRRRYADFLKIDFPRLPLTSRPALFRKLCAAGDELVALHLMDAQFDARVTYPISGDDTVEKVRYTDPSESSKTGKAWINKTQYFDGVPPAIWAFTIGGYQVCQKWLKDRKGRKLSNDDMMHYQNIVGALTATTRLMAEIDGAIEQHGGWPIQ